MKRAGIPRVGPTGEKRTFHSLRHTYAKRALETGRQLIWLSRHLRHSSLKVTSDVYGHFGRQERKAEAELMAGEHCGLEKGFARECLLFQAV
jgi:integrase